MSLRKEQVSARHLIGNISIQTAQKTLMKRLPPLPPHVWTGLRKPRRDIALGN